MSGLSVRDGFSVSRREARERVESAIDLRKLFRVIDTDPALVGAGIVFIDSDFNVVVLREFQPICSVAVKRVILREAPRHMSALEFHKQLEFNVRESTVIKEAIGAGLACGGAYLSWKVVYGGIMAAPFTAGVGLLVTAIGATAAVAGSLQCLVSLGRVGTSMFNPETLDEVDAEPWYQSMTAVLDSITLAGAALSIYSTLRYTLAKKAATGKSYREILRGLSRRERLALTNEVHRYRKDTFGLPRRYSNTEIKQQTYTQLRDVLAAGASIGGSLHSGHLKPIAVAVYGEF
ncbi:MULTISPECIES: NAD synthetase [unclassified Pseudomonas]|uniref:NAD synthetase n=1 Tax=unclassified Pseudomonas TaxID=196821 RepID=UPI000D3CEFCE|nr:MULTISPECIES: NAD synthetase [unclassified Pseudomonas]RAU43109.1 NAD synthetase [Pseudomonas sp. RIT 409]RAU53399.1 NAD synthetase [Pseudomonas sp. RIT 412]